MTNTHSINEVPATIWQKLYDLRLIDDLEIPYEEYITRYKFVVVDEIPYAVDSPDTMWRVQEYNTSYNGSIFHMTLPDAVIKEGRIKKNRFGYK